MADEEQIVVSVEGDQPGGDVVVHQDDAVAELKRQYEALEADNKKRQEREEAANRRAAEERAAADRARQDAAAARAEVSSSQTSAFDAGIAAANASAAQAKADYAAALEKGDFSAAADAQERMAEAVADRKRLNEAKADLDARKSSPRDEPPPRSASDPFEDHLTKFTPRTADWMRQHRDWVMDPRKSAKLTGAHHMAVGDGLTPDTDEYFEAVEKTLGLRDGEAARNGSGNGQTRTQTRRSAPPVAPVNGGAGAHSSGANDNRGGNQVYLTKSEAASAQDGTLVWNYDDPSGKGRFKKGDPIGIQEMARRKQAMQKQGLYDKNNIEA
jgi:hypothetical protein